MSQILVHLFRHNRWANGLMVEACRSLSENQLDTTVEGTYGSIRDTLNHLASAEGGYVFRLTGQPRPLVHDDPFPGVDRISEILERTGAALEEVAAGLNQEKTIEVNRPEGAVTIPAFVILLQAVNHATDHRSHIATILTQLGIEPPGLDLWDYNEQVLGA